MRIAIKQRSGKVARLGFDQRMGCATNNAKFALPSVSAIHTSIVSTQFQGPGR